MFWYFTIPERMVNHFKCKTFKTNGFIEAYNSESLAKFHRAPIDTHMITLLIQRDNTKVEQASQNLLLLNGEDFPFEDIQAINRIV